MGKDFVIIVSSDYYIWLKNNLSKLTFFVFLLTFDYLGEMLRKKRREKDGHKDPLLVEVSRLQDNIMKDIAELRQEAEEAEKKQSELDKVAQILGINISDKSQKSSNDSKEPTEKPGKAEKSKSPEKVSSSSNSSCKVKT